MAGNPLVQQSATTTVASGRWVTNPKHLPLNFATANVISMKRAAATIDTSNVATFWTAFALRGAQTSITGADTYVTLADISSDNGGFLVNVVCPHDSAGTTMQTIRITTDNVVYVIAPTAVLTANSRLVLGPVATNANATLANAATIGGGGDAGFSGTAVGGVNNSISLVVVPPESAMSYGMPVLRFESSLKVEVKCSVLSVTDTAKQCGASWFLGMA